MAVLKQLPFEMMRIALFCLAASVGFLTYWVAERLPLPTEQIKPRQPLYWPLERWLQSEMDQTGLDLPGYWLLHAALLAGALGGWQAWQMGFWHLVPAAVLLCGQLPWWLVRAVARWRRRRAVRAVPAALTEIARLMAVRPTPLQALKDAVPLLGKPLRWELERALADSEAGLPLPAALREMAIRCGGPFGLHGLAGLVAIYEQTERPLAPAMVRLAERSRQIEALPRLNPAGRLGALALGWGLVASGLLGALHLWIGRVPALLDVSAALLGAVLFGASGVGLTCYGLLMMLPTFSGRRELVARMRPAAGPYRPPKRGARYRDLLALGYPVLVAHLVTETEAGRTLQEALVTSPPVLPEPLRGEMEALLADMRALPVSTALERLAMRCGLPAVSTLIEMVQAPALQVREALGREERYGFHVAGEGYEGERERGWVVGILVVLLGVVNGFLVWL